MKWWEAPEWGKPLIMKFPDPRPAARKVALRDVDEEGEVHKVHIFVGTKAESCWPS